MKYSRTLRSRLSRSLTIYTFATALVFVVCSSFGVTQSLPSQPPAGQWSNDLNKYPGLLPEFAHLLDKLQRNLQFPLPRAQSRILPLLPESTVFYAAFPNYGDASHQALQIFHQELQESPVLRDWWQHVNSDDAGKAEDVLQKFYQLSQYLGDEIVVSGATKGTEHSVLFVAEIRKPGLDAFLQQMLAEIPATPKPALRILEPQELAIAKDMPGEQPIILVRSDFVIGATDVATLRSFNARLAHNSAPALASTAFGQRLVGAYKGSVTIVGAVDLHTILSQLPQTAKDKDIALQRTGFSDVKYAVWEHTSVAGREISQGELSFNGPRHGVASWLAAPRHLGSLDFVSPKTIFAASLALTSPAQIFDDIQELASASASASKPNVLAMAVPMAQALGINLKDDLLGLLTGEIAVELDSAAPHAPAWRLVLGIKDQNHFRQTLSTLLAASHVQPEQSEEDGTTYYSIPVPSPQTSGEISYTFVGGYLVVGSSHKAVAEAVGLHHSGGSLGKSQTFLASLPPGHPSGISAVLYEDLATMIALGSAQAPSAPTESLAPLLQTTAPVIVCAYGDEDAIREASTSTAFDPTTVLVVAAVAIPSLLRSRIAANEAAAVGMVRTIDNAQVTYSVTYPQRGFAPNLAMLHVDPATSGTATANHPELMDATLGNGGCTASSWCVKNGFRFQVTADCRQRQCREFVAVATPVTSNTGARNFCSTSDGVIRFQLGPPLSSPVTTSECKSWQPLQ